MAAPASPQKTHKVLTTLPPGTVIAPIHEYDEDQRKMMKDLREVSPSSFLAVLALTHLLVRRDSSSAGH